MKETLSELRQRQVGIKRQLESVGRTLSGLQAELAMVDYRIASHKDYKPIIQRPILYEHFDNGKVFNLPKEYQRISRKKSVINLDGLDLGDLDL